MQNVVRNTIFALSRIGKTDEVREAAKTLVTALDEDIDWSFGPFTFYREDIRCGWRRDDGYDVYVEDGDSGLSTVKVLDGTGGGGILHLNIGPAKAFLSALNHAAGKQN